jgi:PRKCA-binding protein
VCYFPVQDIVFQLQRLVTAMAKYHNECHSVLKSAQVFPIEVDLSRSTFTYDTSNQFNDGCDDDREEQTAGEEPEKTPTLPDIGADVDLISTD